MASEEGNDRDGETTNLRRATEEGTTREAETIIMRKTISPYDITSNDNPGSLLTHVQLKGENYDEWARALRTALRARKKFGFVDGSIKRPDEGSPDLEDWWTNNSLLVSWIMNTIESGLRSTMSHMEVARDLWEDIRERFSMVNGPRIPQLRAELVECKQRGSIIVSYFGKLKKLWEELANFEQMPMCKCGLCICNLGAVLEKKREEEKAHQFLMGLDETIYGTVRSNLLAQDPLPNLNRLYSTLIQEERVKIMSRGKEERGEVMSFAMQTDFKSRNRAEGKEKHTVCSHCNRTGHETDSCFQLIGYPDWWGDRARGTGRGNGRGRGGPRDMFGRGRGGLARANATQIFKEKGDASGLSGEQWQTLLNILNTTKIGATEKLTGKKARAFI